MVVGIAILSLTPASPAFLRELDVVALHGFRAVDLCVRAIYGWFDRAGPSTTADSAHPHQTQGQDPSADLSATALDLANAAEGVRRWDALQSEVARSLAPDRSAIVARVIALRDGSRRLLLDAGKDSAVEVGDPVLFGEIAIGLVTRVERGICVVETPWSEDARFAGTSRSLTDEAVRFVMVGRGRTQRLAAVQNPEHLQGLVAGREVTAPDVRSWLPPSVAVFPAGTRIGVLEVDKQREAIQGEEGFIVRPLFDPVALDAVVILVRGSAQSSSAFVERSCGRLAIGLLSSWRDGGAIFGPYLADGAAITVGGFLVGVVDAAQLGAARVRGVGDPGYTFPLLVVPEGDRDPFPQQVVARKWREGLIEYETIGGGEQAPRPGDLVVSAGRGRQVPRGLPVGRVVKAGGSRFEVARPRRSMHDEAVIHLRPEFPLRPWGD